MINQKLKEHFHLLYKSQNYFSGSFNKISIINLKKKNSNLNLYEKNNKKKNSYKKMKSVNLM